VKSGFTEVNGLYCVALLCWVWAAALAICASLAHLETDNVLERQVGWASGMLRKQELSLWFLNGVRVGFSRCSVFYLYLLPVQLVHLIELLVHTVLLSSVDISLQNSTVSFLRSRRLSQASPSRRPSVEKTRVEKVLFLIVRER